MFDASRSSWLLPVAASFVLFCGAGSGAAQQPYKIVDHWKVGGTGGWDYLLADPANHLLYVTHGPRVEVIDTSTGKAVGAVTGLKGTHGVALDPDGQVGYISDGAANSVVVFDRKSFATLATIPVGTNPDGISYEPVTKTVWTFNGRSSDATVVDAASRTVVATVKLGDKPEFPQVDGEGHIFVNLETKNTVVKLDAASRAVVATWPLTGCDSPSGMAFDKAHHRLFSVCDGKKMAVVDTETGKQIATPGIGDGPDAAGYSAKHELVFSSNGEGTLSVVDAAHGYKAVETLPTKKGARTMAYDESTDRVYLASAEYGPTPAATAAVPRPRPSVVPDSFTVLVVGRK